MKPEWEAEASSLISSDASNHLMLTYPIDEIRLSGGVRLPVFLRFKPVDGRNTTGLGPGWSLSLFDSMILQTDENEFTLCAPDGTTGRLKRIGHTDVLEGSTWKGVIQEGSRIKLSSCGGWSSMYVSGRLVELKHDGDSIVITRNAIGSEISLNGGIVARLLLPEGLVDVGSLTVNDERHDLHFGKRPQVVLIHGRLITTGPIFTLDGIASGLKSRTASRSFDFGLNDRLECSLSVLENSVESNIYQWNGPSGCMICDRTWYYSGYEQGGYMMSRRFLKNDITVCDYRYDDLNSGVCITQVNGGPLVKTTKFAGGLLIGRTRKVESIDKQVVNVIYSMQYDQDGRPLNINTPSGRYSLHYTQNEQEVSFQCADGTGWKKYYRDSVLQKMSFSDGSSLIVKSQADTPVVRYVNGTIVKMIPASQVGLELMLDLEGLKSL